MDDLSRNLQHTAKWQVISLFSFLFSTTVGQLQYSIPEETKRGSVVGNLANDLGLEATALASRKFQIIPKAKKQYFAVNFENGDLFVHDRVDRETVCDSQPNCFVNLEAVIENPLSFYIVTIEIQDVNDNAPKFSKKHFDIGISELTLPGAHFSLGNAQDPDVDSNSVQRYSLTATEYFSLGERITKDGIKYPEIILEKSLDREKQSLYELVLTAFDGGLPPQSGTALLRITVEDVNDNFPVFSKDTYLVQIHENSPVGFLVIHLNATDKDEGLNAIITY